MMETGFTWWEANRPIIWFLYGQVFFLLGSLIFTQAGRLSRLALARGLPRLAAFGFLHGLYAWGYLFIPLQAPYLPTGVVHALRVLRTLLLAGSFAMLLSFGRRLLDEEERTTWFASRVWALSLVAFWAAATVGIVWAEALDVYTALHTADALARYALALPAGLLAAYGLRQHAVRYIRPLAVDRIYRTLRVAGLSLAAFGVLMPIVGPPAPFLPAQWVNGEAWLRVVHAPPEIFVTLLGALLAWSFIRGMEVFVVETQRRLDHMELQHIQNQERERIARDLHDGALQQVYAAGLLARALERQVPEALRPEVERITAALDAATTEMRRLLHEWSPKIHVADIERALRNLVEEAQHISGTEVRFHSNGAVPYLDPKRAVHVIAFVREALANAIRHARTPYIDVRLDRRDAHMVICVQDHGRGMPVDLRPGFGLKHMEERALLLGGRLRITSQPRQGTRVELWVPLQHWSVATPGAPPPEAEAAPPMVSSPAVLESQ